MHYKNNKSIILYMKNKSLIISEDSHYKLKKIALEKRQTISQTTEEIINKEFNKESPTCNNSTTV